MLSVHPQIGGAPISISSIAISLVQLFPVVASNDTKKLPTMPKLSSGYALESQKSP